MDPSTPVSEQPTVMPVPPTPPPKKSYSLAIFLLVFLVVAITGAYVFMTYSTRAPELSARPTSSAATVNAPVLASPLPVIDGSATQLAYLRDPNQDVIGDNELWLVDANTGIETQLPLKNVFNVYKHLGSSKLFYLTGENDGTIHIYDLSSGTDLAYTVLKHPVSTAKVSISINSIDSISPSGDYLIFQAGFYEDCPPMSPFPSGFEGGYGPCMPDESLEVPSGNYLYDVKAGKATPLTELFRVARWDEEGGKLYYITDNATKALDLSSKTIALYDTTPFFGYFTYPLLKSDRYIKYEGSTEKGTRIYITNAARAELGEIEGYAPWAILQPFIQSSPDETNIIYVKTALDDQSMRLNYLRKFDMATMSSSALTVDDKPISYANYLSWLDNDTFITSEDVVESTSYTNANKNLVKINIKSGELIPLTTHSKVYQFNVQ